MKLQGRFITSSIFGILPQFGSGTINSMPMSDVDGLPLEVEGANGDIIFWNAYVSPTAGQIYLSLKGSLAQVGQLIPVKSIKFVNNTVPAGSGTIIQSDFFGNGTPSPFEANTTFYYNNLGFTPLSHWTPAGGDDINMEIEFDNDVIGVTAPNTGSIMTRMVG